MNTTTQDIFNAFAEGKAAIEKLPQLEAAIIELQGANVAQFNTIIKREETILAKNAEITSLNGEIVALKEERDNYGFRNLHLEEALVGVKDAARSAMATLDGVLAAIDPSHETAEVLTNRANTYEHEMGQFRQEKEAAQAELGDVQTELLQYNSDLDEEISNNAVLRVKIKELESRIAGAVPAPVSDPSPSLTQEARDVGHVGAEQVLPHPGSTSGLGLGGVSQGDASSQGGDSQGDRNATVSPSPVTDIFERPEGGVAGSTDTAGQEAPAQSFDHGPEQTRAFDDKPTEQKAVDVYDGVDLSRPYHWSTGEGKYVNDSPF